MTTPRTPQWATLCMQAMDEEVAALGHTLTWKRLPRRRGTALVFEGTCPDCAATVNLTETSVSCGTVRYARWVRCSGPGTSVLTEIESDHADEQFAGLVSTFGAQARDALWQ